MSNAAVSVVIPVYNAQDGIKQCLASLLKQTFKNFEIILLNDGSTDESLK
ncbi:glycosyl transferase, partial [Streptococcus anginosus]